MELSTESVEAFFHTIRPLCFSVERKGPTVLNDSDVPVTAEIQPNDIDGMMSFVRGGGRIHLDDQRHRASVNGKREV